MDAVNLVVSGDGISVSLCAAGTSKWTTQPRQYDTKTIKAGSRLAGADPGQHAVVLVASPVAERHLEAASIAGLACSEQATMTLLEPRFEKMRFLTKEDAKKNAELKLNMYVDVTDSRNAVAHVGTCRDCSETTKTQEHELRAASAAVRMTRRLRRHHAAADQTEVDTGDLDSFIQQCARDRHLLCKQRMELQRVRAALRSDSRIPSSLNQAHARQQEANRRRRVRRAQHEQTQQQQQLQQPAADEQDSSGVERKARAVRQQLVSVCILTVN